MRDLKTMNLFERAWVTITASWQAAPAIDDIRTLQRKFLQLTQVTNRIANEKSYIQQFRQASRCFVKLFKIPYSSYYYLHAITLKSLMLVRI